MQKCNITGHVNIAGHAYTNKSDIDALDCYDLLPITFRQCKELKPSKNLVLFNLQFLIVNDSKCYVPIVPMIIYFKALKYLSGRKTSFIFYFLTFDKEILNQKY